MCVCMCVCVCVCVVQIWIHRSPMKIVCMLTMSSCVFSFVFCGGYFSYIFLIVIITISF